MLTSFFPSATNELSVELERRASIVPDEVHIWSLILQTIPNHRWLALEATLSSEERARASRFRFDRDRHAYVAARGLARHMLSHFAGCLPTAWQFTDDKYGKPRIVDPLPNRPLSFNVTHTDQLAAVAVTLTGDIGIDAESIALAPADSAITSYYLTDEEVAQVQNLPDDAKAERFIRLWTLKEAFIKATGKGLSQPLSHFAFVSIDPVRVIFHDSGLGDPRQWVFWQQQVGMHMLALAIRWPLTLRPRILYRSICISEHSGNRTGGLDDTNTN